MTRAHPRPPVLAAWWIAAVVPAPDRETFLGDLEEQFHDLADRDGSRAARRWYWQQAIRAPFRWRAVARGPKTVRAEGAGMVEQWIRDLAHAVRLMRRRPAQAITAVVTLGLGIGLTAAMFTVVRGVLIRPLPYADPDRLARVFTTFDDGERGSTTVPDFAGWKAARSFSDLAAYQTGSGVLTETGDPARLRLASVTPNMLDVLGTRPVLGRAFTDADADTGAAPVVLVSDRFWRARLGADPDPTSRRVTIDGQVHAVAGVMPPAFAFPSPLVDVWLPLGFAPDAAADIGNHSLAVVGRLMPDAGPIAAGDELAGIMAGVGARLGRTQARGAAVLPLPDYLVADARQPLLLMMGAVSFVLLIATVNVAHLLFGRALGRRREMQVRAALGATPSRIARHTVVESLLLSTAGGAAGLLIAWWLVPGLMATAAGVPRAAEVRIDAAVLATTVGVSLLAGLAAGLVPAWWLARTAGRSAPDTARTMTTASGRAGRLLVAVEVAVSFVLLAGASLLVHSFVRLASIDPGLDADRLLAARVALPESRYPDNGSQIAFAQAVLGDLRAMPDVEAAGLVSHLPFEADFWRYGSIVPGRPERKVPIAFRLVSPGYFEAMGIPLIEGRAMSEADTASSPLVLVVNETAAREMFPDGAAIGGRLEFSFCRATPCEVVGVVGDVRHLGLEEAEEPAMYASFWQKPEPWMSEMAFVVRTAESPAALVEPTRQRIWAHDAELPLLRIDTMSGILASTLAPRRFAMTMMAIFAGIAGVMALVGIQSVVARSVAERRQEIGLRMALGASAGSVLGWMTRQAMTPVAIGLAIGLAGALSLARFLQSQLVDLSAQDPATLVVAAVVLAVAALVAVLLPARHATKVDQLEVLRG